MKKKNSKKQPKLPIERPAQPASPSVVPASSESNAKRSWAIAGAAVFVIALASLAYYFFTPKDIKPANSSRAENNSPTKDTGTAEARSDMTGSLLQQMAHDDGKPAEGDLTGAVPTSKQLETQYSIITENQNQINQFREQASTALAKKDAAEAQRIVALGQPQMKLLNARLAAFEKDLGSARNARPNDPTVQWLTGELLMSVGGEPENILPYFTKALAGHVDQPHLYVSLATLVLDLNQFQPAYDYAQKALEKNPKGQAEWEIYSRTAFAVERFVEVVLRLGRVFPGDAPSWVAPIRRDAQNLQKLWVAEQAQRQQDQKRGDLPQVKFTIEHRKFAAPADGGSGAGINNTGRGEVTLELFEDQAPATVSNFVHLVETGFYDGTSFYWAAAGQMVVGGDPNTKNDNPSDDGIGGPGYVIPDEFKLPNTRGHFRGTISTVQNGPNRAGSQFFISLIAAPEFNGNSTAFGRVIKGQEVLDQITEGRTNREVGQFGKLIPGDLIVHAEIVRKRPHAYVVTKLEKPAGQR